MTPIDFGVTRSEVKVRGHMCRSTFLVEFRYMVEPENFRSRARYALSSRRYQSFYSILSCYSYFSHQFSVDILKIYIYFFIDKKFVKQVLVFYHVTKCCISDTKIIQHLVFRWTMLIVTVVDLCCRSDTKIIWHLVFRWNMLIVNG